MPTVENGTLFRESPAECPKTEPTGACTADFSCHYAATKRGPCEFDACHCQNGAWSCVAAME
jgi:hypothetical protein